MEGRPRVWCGCRARLGDSGWVSGKKRLGWVPLPTQMPEVMRCEPSIFLHHGPQIIFQSQRKDLQANLVSLVPLLADDTNFYQSWAFGQLTWDCLPVDLPGM